MELKSTTNTPPPLQRGPSMKRAILIPQKQTLRLDLNPSTNTDLDALVNNQDFKPRISNQRLLHRHSSLGRQDSVTSTAGNSSNSHVGMVQGSTILNVDKLPLSNDLSTNTTNVNSINKDEQYIMERFLEDVPKVNLSREDSVVTRNRVIEEMYRIQERAQITPEERQRLFQLAVSMDAPKLARRLVVEARDTESEANGGSFLTGEIMSVDDEDSEAGSRRSTTTNDQQQANEDDDQFCKAFDEVERIRKRILQRASNPVVTSSLDIPSSSGSHHHLLNLNLQSVSQSTSTLHPNKTSNNTATASVTTAHNNMTSARRLSRELKESPRMFISPRPPSPKSSSAVPSSSSSASKWGKIHPEPVIPSVLITPRKSASGLSEDAPMSKTPRSPLPHSRNEDVLDALDSLIGPSTNSASKNKKKSFRTSNGGGGSNSSNVSVSSNLSDDKKLSSSQKSNNSSSGNSQHPPMMTSSASSHNFSFHDPFSKPKEDQKKYAHVNAEQQQLLETAQHNLSMIKRQFSMNSIGNSPENEDDQHDEHGDALHGKDNYQSLISSSVPTTDYKIHPVDFSEIKQDTSATVAPSSSGAGADIMSQAAMKQAQMHLPPMKGKGVPPPSSSAGSNSPLRSHATTALQLNPHKKVQLNHAKMLLASPLSDWLHISKSMESKKEYFDAHNAPLPLLSNGSQQSDSNSVGSSSKTELAVSRDEFDDPRSTHNHKHHHKQTGKDNKPSTAANSSVNNAVADNKNGNSGERHRRFSFEAEDIQRLSAKYAHNQAVKGQPNGTPNPTLLSSLELFVDKDNGHVINDSNNKALQHAKKSLDILQDHISMIQQFSPTSRGGGVGPGYLMPPSSISSVASKSTLITPSHIDFTFTPTAQNANMDPDRVIPRINSFIGTNNDGGEEELIRKSLRSPKGPSQSNLLNSGNTGNLPLPLKKIPSFRNNTTGSINMNELKEEKKLTSQSMMFDNNYSEMDQSQLHRPSTTSTGNYSYAPSSQPPYRPPLMVRQPSVSSTSTNIGSNGGIGISPRPGSSSSSSGNNSAVPAASTPVLPMQRTNSAIRNAGGMLLTREGSSSSNYNSPSQLLASSNKIVPMSGANTPLNSHSRMYALAAALDAGDAVGKLMAEMVVSSKTKKP